MGSVAIFCAYDARKLLAERVNELCREKEITYEELSSKSEVPIETVLQMADGSVKNPGIFAIAKICEGLDVSLKDFLDTECKFCSNGTPILKSSVHSF